MDFGNQYSVLKMNRTMMRHGERTYPEMMVVEQFEKAPRKRRGGPAAEQDTKPRK
jgi:hypothetical protein